MSFAPENRIKAAAVGAAFGTPDPKFDDSWQVACLLPDGSSLHFYERQHGRLEISASVPAALRDHRPYYRNGEAPKTSISVSADKSVAQIVADVQRRLLPEHVRDLTECQCAKQRSDDYEACCRANLQGVATALGGVPVATDAHTGKVKRVEFGNYGDAVDFEAETSGDDRLRLKISCSPAVTAAIAALCKQLSQTAAAPSTYLIKSEYLLAGVFW